MTKKHFGIVGHALSLRGTPAPVPNSEGVRESRGGARNDRAALFIQLFFRLPSINHGLEEPLAKKNNDEKAFW
jgi:hypothetical protein